MIVVGQGANGVQILATIVERTATGSVQALNLTDMTVILHVKRSTGVVAVTGTITDAPNGKVTFTLTSAVLAVGGETYETELEIRHGSHRFYEPGPNVHVRVAVGPREV